MKRSVIWCIGLCLAGVLACERYPGGAENTKESLNSVAPEVDAEERAEEMPAKAEDEQVQNGKISKENQAMKMLVRLQREAADLQREVSNMETKINAAGGSAELQERLKEVQSLVREAQTTVGALENVKNLSQYDAEMRSARVALRTARQGVDNFRTELKKSTESMESLPPRQPTAGQTAP